MRRLFAAAGCALAAAGATGCGDRGALERAMCALTGGVPGADFGHYRDCYPPGSEGRPGGPPVYPSARSDSFRGTIRANVTRRPAPRRRGGRGRVRMEHRGRIALVPHRRAHRTRRVLRGFKRGRFRSRLSLRAGGRDAPAIADGYLAIGFGRRGASCLRVTGHLTTSNGPMLAQVYFRTAGGTGRAARLRVTGQAPYAAGATRFGGTLNARRGRPKRPPRACRRLLARVRPRA